MKRIFTVLTAVIIAALVGTLHPAQVFADSVTEYLSEVKIFMGDYSAAAAEGFTLLKDGDTPVDLNRKAGGGLGSRGDKAVYLGYKTTRNRDEAITDLALMNMKGGYSVDDYNYLMETQMKSQIIPLVDGILAAVDEYRENYTAGVQRALYINGILNKFIDDDTGKGLGDLLLNDTVYEYARPVWDALSAAEKEKTTFYAVNNQVRDSLPSAEKNNHADILTIVAQSNGKATLMMQNLLTRAADTNDSSWLERFSDITYDDLVESTGMAPTDADIQLAKLYDDSALQILDMWDDLGSMLLGYDDAVKRVENYDISKYENALQALNEVTEETSAEEALRILNEFETAQIELLSIKADVRTIAVHDRLGEMEYDDGTMLDFFTMDADELADDTTLLYPLAASLTDGQKAGLEFVSLMEMLVIALTDEDGYNDADLDIMSEISIYDGVDREIYEMCAVGLTSDALRAKAALENEEERSMFSDWSVAMIAITGASFLAFAGSAISWGVYANKVSALTKTVNSELKQLNMSGRGPIAGMLLDNLDNAWSVDDVYRLKPEWETQMGRLTSRSSLCKGLTIGLGVAAVIIAGVTTYLTWQDMKEYYKVEFISIPRYMVDEKDIIGYNKKGEKIILKNQTAYYKAVSCNRAESDEFYKILGKCADMNGDVGKQWLALYSVKKELMDPIIASSLKVVTESADIPPGYTTGIHMFGSDAAFNLNNSLYDWNNSAPSVYVYFRTDDTAAPVTVGSNFTNGTLALAGVGGMAVGSLVTALAMKKKKKDPAAEQE